MTMCERMTEERLLEALRAIEGRFCCKLYVSAHQIKLSSTKVSLIWDKSFLLGKARGEVRAIVLDAVQSKFVRRQDKELGTAHLQHLTLIVSDAPKEEITKAEEVIKEVKEKKKGPRQQAFRFKFA